MDSKPAITSSAPKKVRKPRVKKEKVIKAVKPKSKRKGQPELMKSIIKNAKEIRAKEPSKKWTECVKEGSKMLKK